MKELTDEMIDWMRTLSSDEHRFVLTYFKAEFQGGKQPAAVQFGIKRKRAKELRLETERRSFQ